MEKVFQILKILLEKTRGLVGRIFIYGRQSSKDEIKENLRLTIIRTMFL